MSIPPLISELQKNPAFKDQAHDFWLHIVALRAMVKEGWGQGSGTVYLDAIDNLKNYAQKFKTHCPNSPLIIELTTLPFCVVFPQIEHATSAHSKPTYHRTVIDALAGITSLLEPRHFVHWEQHLASDWRNLVALYGIKSSNKEGSYHEKDAWSADLFITLSKWIETESPHSVAWAQNHPTWAKIITHIAQPYNASPIEALTLVQNSKELMKKTYTMSFLLNAVYKNGHNLSSFRALDTLAPTLSTWVPEHLVKVLLGMAPESRWNLSDDSFPLKEVRDRLNNRSSNYYSQMDQTRTELTDPHTLFSQLSEHFPNLHQKVCALLCRHTLLSDPRYLFTDPNLFKSPALSNKVSDGTTEQEHIPIPSLDVSKEIARKKTLKKRTPVLEEEHFTIFSSFSSLDQSKFALTRRAASTCHFDVSPPLIAELFSDSESFTTLGIASSHPPDNPLDAHTPKNAPDAKSPPLGPAISGTNFSLLWTYFLNSLHTHTTHYPTSVALRALENLSKAPTYFIAIAMEGLLEHTKTPEQVAAWQHIAEVKNSTTYDLAYITLEHIRSSDRVVADLSERLLVQMHQHGFSFDHLVKGAKNSVAQRARTLKKYQSSWALLEAQMIEQHVSQSTPTPSTSIIRTARL